MDATLRYSDMTGARWPFQRLKDSVRLRTFLSELYMKTLTRFNWVAFVGIIDKPQYLRTYGTRPIDRHLPQDPHLVAFTFVVERFVTFLAQEGAKGRAIYESRDPWRDAYLQWEYAKMHVSGTQYLRNSRFNDHLPCWIEFVPKAQAGWAYRLQIWSSGQPLGRSPDLNKKWVEWEVIQGRFWRGNQPTAPGQLGMKVFPENLAREWLVVRNL